MTEAEFLSRARYGATKNGTSPVNGATFWPALAEFLRRNGFHDVAHAVEVATRYEGTPT